MNPGYRILHRFPLVSLFPLIQSQEVYNVFLFSMFLVIYYVEYIGYIYIYILYIYIQGEQKKDMDWHFSVLNQSF